MPPREAHSAIAAAWHVPLVFPRAMNSQLLKQIVNELAASQLHWLLWFSAKWTVLGALIGLITGIVFILLFKRFGWYQSGWRLAGWVRWPLWIFSVMLCALLAATAGLC
jgi:hypothetical protein